MNINNETKINMLLKLIKDRLETVLTKGYYGSVGFSIEVEDGIIQVPIKENWTITRKHL